MHSPKRTAAFIQKRSHLCPTLAIVLGSGFQGVLDKVQATGVLPYNKVPGFPLARVTGHAGKLVFGYLGPIPVIVLAGRAHYYEGHSMATLTYPIRVLAELGIRDILLTNASGGIAKAMRPGDLMLFKDHINFMGRHPLRGPEVVGRTRFVDLTQAYDPGLAKILKQAARRAKARLHEGVYVAVSGPSYETPAEIQAFARLGAHAVGMSTVPETIVARQCGLRVAALSCITNPAAGLSPRPLSHGDVLRTGLRASRKIAALLESFGQLYAQAMTALQSGK